MLSTEGEVELRLAARSYFQGVFLACISDQAMSILIIILVVVHLSLYLLEC